MSGKSDQQRVQQVADAVTGLLAEAVRETIEKRSPDPSRECIAALLEVDRRALPEESGGPSELMAMLAMVRWAGLARDALADRPDRVEEVLGWIEQALGRRCRVRARYTSGALRSEQDAGQIVMYSQALGDDFLPSLVWLIAGTVALHGNGDVDWLRRLEQGALTGT